MLTNPYSVRAMLRTYGKQLVTGRRLARYLRGARGPDAADDAGLRSARRRALVEKVAREIIDNLLVAGEENPLVEEIKETLNERFRARLLFEYPFLEQELQIFRETPGGVQELTPSEMNEVLVALWDITTQKVDETML
mgnify:CR=1 FL=1